MIIDYELIAGVKVGIEADQVYMMDEDEYVDEEPTEVIYLHLFFFTISIILNYKKLRIDVKKPPKTL